MKNAKQRFTTFLKGRNFSSTVLVAIVIALVVFVNIIIYTLSTVFPLYLYSADTMDTSISDACDLLFEEPMRLGQRVTVTFCSYENDVASHSTGKFVYDTAKQFAERYPDFIDLRFVNVITKLDSDGKSIADELAVYTADGKNIVDSTSVIFSTETSFKVVTDVVSGVGYIDFYNLDESNYITAYNGEEVFASSVIWALTENHGKAYFTVGHGETAFTTLYSILTSAGYEVDQVNLRKSDVPEDADLVIISNPTSDFERGAENSSLITEYDRLMSYAKRGGKFMVFIDPVMKKLPVLESFVAGFGISFDEDESGERLIIRELSGAINLDRFAFVTEYADNELTEAIIKTLETRTDNPGGEVFVNKAAALVTSGRAKPLLLSSSSSVCQADGKTVDSSGSYTVAAYSTAPNESAEDAKLFFMSEAMITAADAVFTERYSNKDFLYSLFDNFFDKGDMPYGCRTVLYEESVVENLTLGTKMAWTVALLALPVVVSVLGAVIIVRRKNR